MKLVIVESPAKARKIGPWLGSGTRVLASRGHVRDLPSAEGAVDPARGFAMQWREDPDKRADLDRIAKAAKSASEIVLATDPDREGEAISWHLLETIRARRALARTPVRRVTFNAITRNAVLEAMQRPRDIDQALVDAYFARRALDYLVGFTLSPVLWQRLPKLAASAGRVQSVALRLVCEREWEIAAFRAEEYWQVVATMHPGPGEGDASQAFEARLTELDGKRLPKLALGSKDKAQAALATVREGRYTVSASEAKPVIRRPPPPFTTATLQKDASRKLRLDAKACMREAQALYEAGRITYMRTDSVTMDAEGVREARSLIATQYGQDWLHPRPRRWNAAARNAQEAHEAIRPTTFAALPQASPESASERLYALIWQRAVASEMADARFERTTIDLVADHGRALLHASGDVMTFAGFTQLYTEGRDPAPDGAAGRPASGAEKSPARLPRLSVGDPAALADARAEQHFTRPPPRYTEASLVSALEKLGIGRPSTYAMIMETLRKRDYVRIEAKYLRPQAAGHLVTALLKEQFARYVDYDFTRELEDDLDRVARGGLEWHQLMRRFWTAFEQTVARSHEASAPELHARMTGVLAPWIDGAIGDDADADTTAAAGDEASPDTRRCPKCGIGELKLSIATGAAWVACSRKASDECDYVRPLLDTRGGDGAKGARGRRPERGTSGAQRRRGARGAGAAPASAADGAAAAATSGSAHAPARLLGTAPRGGKNVYLREGPYGWYVQRGEHADKPKRVSLPSGWRHEDLDLARALKLLALPRKVGDHPEGGKVQASIGPHGPYVVHDRHYADLDSVDDVFTVKIANALERLASRAPRGRRGSNDVAGAPVRRKASGTKRRRKKSVRRRPSLTPPRGGCE